MASPRLLEIPQGSLDEPSMIPYSQSSQKNGGKAKARNAFAAKLHWQQMMRKLNVIRKACAPRCLMPQPPSTPFMLRDGVKFTYI